MTGVVIATHAFRDGRMTKFFSSSRQKFLYMGVHRWEAVGENSDQAPCGVRRNENFLALPS